jgi:DNA-binding NtrC family response regulator
MPAPIIVIAQSDPGVARDLAKDLHCHFAHVAVAQDPTELRTMLLQHEARVAVLDLDMVSMEDIRDLTGTFDDLVIVCTHHSPDEQMWMDALSAGAVEFCHPGDLHTILRAARSAPPRHLKLVA